MKKVSLVVAKNMQNNIIFTKNQHLHDLVTSWNKLKEEFKKYNYDLATSDINLIEDSDIIIYANEMPKKLSKKHSPEKSFIILYESQFIKPRNFDKKRHIQFNKLFTWSDDLVDNKKYIKLQYTHNFPKNINMDLKKKTKLCLLISSNKIPPYTNKNSLYGERIKAIRWFEKYQLNSFSLYGIGWERYIFSGFFTRVFNNISFIRDGYIRIFNKKYISYKGKITNKQEIMENYKFSICYENVKNISGYISEKIFDSFFSGCVPIYLGADNITKYIPKECFIDKRDFDSYEKLFNFINTIEDSAYIKYLNSINQFLKSKKSNQFKADNFVKTIIKYTL